MKRFFVLAVIALMVIASGCGGDGTTGTVRGYVKAPNGTDVIIGAQVTVQGTALTAMSDASGRYTIQNVPSGRQTVIAVKGAFRSEVTVSVSGGETASAPDAKLAPIGKIGVVAGSYDDIGAVLSELGVSYDSLSSILVDDVFATPSKLAEYSVIFLACGGDSYLDPIENADIITNMRDFVNDGGRVYMSDWATLLTDSLFPGKVTLKGQIGVGDQTVTASITNPDISSLLGKSTCPIYYNLDIWMVIDSVASGVDVDLSGTIEYHDFDSEEGVTLTATKPLLVHFAYGDGDVVLTTFHNEANVTEDAEKILKHLTFGF